MRAIPYLGAGSSTARKAKPRDNRDAYCKRKILAICLSVYVYRSYVCMP